MSDTIPSFIEQVKRYFTARNAHDLTCASFNRPAGEAVPGEAAKLADIRTFHERHMDARDEAMRLGRVLADELHQRGHDPRGVLRVVNAMDQGGGPEAVAAVWPEVKADLQVAAMGSGGNATPHALAVGAGYVSSADLAERYGLPPDPLRKRLDRWRKDNALGGGFIQNTERGPRDPAFLYDPQHPGVAGVIQAARQASSQRPAK
ncbi:MAG: hypothetical protein WD009_01010 [Phycisphaeraceae bacterium]